MDYETKKNESFKVCNECNNDYKNILKYKDKNRLTNREIDYIFTICSQCIKKLQSIPLTCVKEKITAYYLINQLRDLYLECHYIYEGEK